MNIEYAKEQFEKYLEDYDRDEAKTKLKIIHTYGVVKCSRRIAEEMKLSIEDIQLAEVIGLLHDIGRFEQIRRYQSFSPETMDHAKFGVKILFEEGLIRKFIEETTFDEIIYTSILKHSDFQLNGIEDERTLLHARMIRDADKLDNFRVKLEDPVETYLGVTAEEIGRADISPIVKEQFFRKESILSVNRKTAMDYWVAFLAYVFDVNFKETLSIIREEDYIRKTVDVIPYSNVETEKTIKEMVELLEKFELK